MFKGKKKPQKGPQNEQDVMAWRNQNKKMKEDMQRAKEEAEQRRIREEQERKEREERERREREEAARREEERRRLEAERIEREKREAEERRIREEQERLERIEREKREAEERRIREEQERLERIEREKREAEERRVREERERQERQEREQREAEERRLQAERRALAPDQPQQPAAAAARAVPRELLVGEKYFLSWDFVAENEGELTVTVDCPVELLMVVDQTWVVARKVGDTVEGYVQSDYLDLNSFVEEAPAPEPEPEPEPVARPAAQTLTFRPSAEETKPHQAPSFQESKGSARTQTALPGGGGGGGGSVGKKWGLKGLKRRKSITALNEIAKSPRTTVASDSSSKIDKKKKKDKDKAPAFEISGPTGFQKKSKEQNNAALAAMGGPVPTSGVVSGTSSPARGGGDDEEELRVIIARALYSSDGQYNEELSFVEGDTLVVYDMSNRDWWQGTTRGKVGYFPASYVQRIPKADVPRKLLEELEAESGVYVE